MTTKLKFTYEGKDYCLEYTRETVVKMEERGFDPTTIISSPNKSLPEFFYGAFLANHRFVDRKVTDAIFDKMADKKALVEILSEMYNEPLKALMSDPEDEGNAIQWEKA